jgi:hypothetical protein
MTATPTYPLPSPDHWIDSYGISREHLLADYHAAYKLLCAASNAFADIKVAIAVDLANDGNYFLPFDYIYNQIQTERETARAHFGALKTYLEGHLLHLSS